MHRFYFLHLDFDFSIVTGRIKIMQQFSNEIINMLQAKNLSLAALVTRMHMSNYQF
jgi:hypothetical protein